MLEVRHQTHRERGPQRFQIVVRRRSKSRLKNQATAIRFQEILSRTKFEFASDFGPFYQALQSRINSAPSESKNSPQAKKEEARKEP